MNKKSETTARLGDKRDQCCSYEDERRKYGLRLSSPSKLLEDDDDDEEEDERAAKKTRKRRRIDSGTGGRRRGKEEEEEEEEEETEEEATVRAKFDAHNARADAFIEREKCLFNDDDDDDDDEESALKALLKSSSFGEKSVRVLGDGLAARYLRRVFGGDEEEEEEVEEEDQRFVTEEDVLDENFEKSEVWERIARGGDPGGGDTREDGNQRSRSGVVVSALESFESRAKIDRLCKKSNLVLVDVGIEDDR